MFRIPSDRLPPGFAERIEHPPDSPPEPAPAATAVLLRDGLAGPEVLLLRRHRSSGFVPGAYVFPGGRVDPGDDDPRLYARADAARDESDPPPAYRMAAVREVFEETGILLARDAAGQSLPDARHDERLARWRDELLEDRGTLLALLEDLDARLDLAGVVYCAHWITPVAETRRYDTRFFLARCPAGTDVSLDPREMTDAVWLTPAEALARFRAARLPMVFPTIRTLESLEGYATLASLLEDFRSRPVEPVLPRIVRTEDGVGIVVGGENAE